MLHLTIINGDCKGKYAAISFCKIETYVHQDCLSEAAYLLAHLRRGSKVVLRDEDGTKWYYTHKGGVAFGDVVNR
jgi:hypothetical protein